MRKRVANIKRKTSETDIAIELNLDGNGKSKIETGIGFLDHMLTLFSKHGLFDLKINAKGDLKVDLHHTNEDVGIALGEAFKKALGDKKGIRRFGNAKVPMEEAVADVTLDISGRPNLYLQRMPVGIAFSQAQDKEGYRLDDAKHFLESFVRKSEITLRIEYQGEDLHHILESIFKAVGRALCDATRIDPRIKGIPSTKGTL